MKFASVMFAMIITWSGAGFASTTDFGNGGNMILSGVDGLEVKGYFYDVYEASARYNITAKFPAAAKCETDYYGNYVDACKAEAQKVAVQLASRLKEIDPKFEALLQSFIQTFWEETRLVDGVLFPVEDSGVGFIPEGSMLKQLAIQHVPINKDDKRYFIAVNLLKYLSVEDQAAMIMHEILYRWAKMINSKITFSERIRYFNALIFSDRIGRMNYTEYVNEKNALVSN